MIAHPAYRPCLPKADLAEKLIASVEEAVRIVMGKLLPSRVHTASELTDRAAARAAKQEQE